MSCSDMVSHQMQKRVLGGNHDIFERRLLDAYLWLVRISQIQISAKISNGRCPRDVIFSISIFVHIHASSWLCVKSCIGIAVSYGVGSNVVHSLRLGNARVFTSGMNNR